MSPPPALEPSTAVLVIAAPIGAEDVPRLCERLRVLLVQSDARVVFCDVRALAADARTVDALARLQLTARRLGCRIRLQRASPELRDLLRLVGLAECTTGIIRPPTSPA